MTTTTLPDIESLSFKIELETRVKAPIDVTFAALLRPDGALVGIALLKPGPAAAGSATLATAMATAGAMCRPSSVPRCLSSLAP